MAYKSEKGCTSSVSNWFLWVCFQQHYTLGSPEMEQSHSRVYYTPLRWQRWLAGVSIHREARWGRDSNGRPRGQLQSGHGLEFRLGTSPAQLPYWLAAEEAPRRRRAYNLTTLLLPFLFAPPSVEWWWCLPELGSVQDHAKLLCQDPGSNNVILVTTVESKEAYLTKGKILSPPLRCILFCAHSFLPPMLLKLDIGLYISFLFFSLLFYSLHTYMHTYIHSYNAYIDTYYLTDVKESNFISWPWRCGILPFARVVRFVVRKPFTYWWNHSHIDVHILSDKAIKLSVIAGRVSILVNSHIVAPIGIAPRDYICYANYQLCICIIDNGLQILKEKRSINLIWSQVISPILSFIMNYPPLFHISINHLHTRENIVQE